MILKGSHLHTCIPVPVLVYESPTVSRRDYWSWYNICITNYLIMKNVHIFVLYPVWSMTCSSGALLCVAGKDELWLIVGWLYIMCSRTNVVQLCAPFLCIPTFKISCKKLNYFRQIRSRPGDRTGHRSNCPKNFWPFVICSCILHTQLCNLYLFPVTDVQCVLLYKNSCK